MPVKSGLRAFKLNRMCCVPPLKLSTFAISFTEQ